MKSHTRKTIIRIWNRIEASDPDISTEQLFSRTCEDATRLFKFKVDSSLVAEALKEHSETTTA
jgi:hypothetical protein